MVEIPFLKKKQEEPDPVAAARQEKLFSRAKKLSTEDDWGKRLSKWGFTQPDGKPDQEKAEMHQHRIVPTSFPTPIKRTWLKVEYPELNVEQMYYWFIRQYHEIWGCEKVIKVVDSHAPSVSSSMFGNIQARMAAQQNQASQYLKGISEMVKGLFQIVREVRVIDERRQYYIDSRDQKAENKQSSEIVLKGIYVDQVEGGSKNPSSVYGLAQTVGFSVLPDLFFRAKVQSSKTIDTDVDKLKFNDKVKEVLKRKLRQYYEWKLRTWQELEQRRRFSLKYLRQHYHTLKIYMSWVMPYLKNIRRLQAYERLMENFRIIDAFETQLIEFEVLFIRGGYVAKPFEYYGVISAHFFHRVKPELAFHTYEYQHKGPMHVGLVDLNLRGYVWTKKQIENYIMYRQEEEIELLGSIDESINAAMDALGDELKRYLHEAGEDVPYKPEKEDKGPPKKSIFEPFTGVIGFFPDFAKSIGIGKKKEPSEDQKHLNKKAQATQFVKEAVWHGFRNFKRGPGSMMYF